MPKSGGNQCGQDGHQDLLEPRPLSAGVRGICIPSPVVWQALPGTPSHRPLQVSQDGSHQVVWFLGGVLFVPKQYLAM